MQTAGPLGVAIFQLGCQIPRPPAPPTTSTKTWVPLVGAQSVRANGSRPAYIGVRCGSACSSCCNEAMTATVASIGCGVQTPAMIAIKHACPLGRGPTLLDMATGAVAPVLQCQLMWYQSKCIKYTGIRAQLHNTRPDCGLIRQTPGPNPEMLVPHAGQGQ